MMLKLTVLLPWFGLVLCVADIINPEELMPACTTLSQLGYHSYEMTSWVTSLRLAEAHW